MGQQTPGVSASAHISPAEDINTGALVTGAGMKTENIEKYD